MNKKKKRVRLAESTHFLRPPGLVLGGWFWTKWKLHLTQFTAPYILKIISILYISSYELSPPPFCSYLLPQLTASFYPFTWWKANEYVLSVTQRQNQYITMRHLYSSFSPLLTTAAYWHLKFNSFQSDWKNASHVCISYSLSISSVCFFSPLKTAFCSSTLVFMCLVLPQTQGVSCVRLGACVSTKHQVYCCIGCLWIALTIQTDRQVCICVCDVFFYSSSGSIFKYWTIRIFKQNLNHLKCLKISGIVESEALTMQQNERSSIMFSFLMVCFTSILQ